MISSHNTNAITVVPTTETEKMLYDAVGQPLNPRLGAYYVPRAIDMPPTDVIYVQTDEPSRPFGAKSVAEIGSDSVAPAMASAIHDATGIWIRTLPYTPERVWQALQQRPQTDQVAAQGKRIWDRIP
jgi:putative selenate reductase molybdopterin-binding subunit